MVKKSKIVYEEINLMELMHTVWKGKWKISVAAIISFIAVLSYQSIQKNNFTAITEIKPLSSLEINKYLALNNMTIKARANTNTTGKISKITPSKLLNLYLDALEDRSIFEDAMHKFNLLEASQYNNDQEYNEAIIRLASSIKILSPSVTSGHLEKGKTENSYHTINFKYHDAKKWKSVLIYVDEFANKIAKKTLLEQYNNILSFLIEEQKYQLEDITIEINNYLIDYDREVIDRIAYLKEQSEIAEELGIKKNTIEVQKFGNQNTLFSNVKTASPFYLRGYEAINKEIELIEVRENKKAFIKELFDLEKEKRAIEQDQTVKRVKLAIQPFVLANNKEFSAASINAIRTKFKYKDNKKMFVPAIVIGLIVGVFYLIISNASQSYRVMSKKD